MSDQEYWVTPEEFALLNEAKKSLGGGEAQSIDEHLARLKSAGDEDGYERAYEAALKAAIDSGDTDEFNRLSNEVRPFDAAPHPSQTRGPAPRQCGRLRKSSPTPHT